MSVQSTALSVATMRILVLLLCLSINAWASNVCGEPDCGDDDVGLLQQRLHKVTEMVCPGSSPHNFTVCPTPDLAKRCAYLDTFTVKGLGLNAGVGALAGCTNNWAPPLNLSEPCFTDIAYRANFDTYAESYNQQDGLHAAWTWNQDTTPTYASTLGRTLIADYYWRFIGYNAKGFYFSAFPETSNATWAFEHDTCIVKAKINYPGFIMFGFASDMFWYGMGFSILNRAGEIVRQYATGDGPVRQDASTPGFMSEYSTTFSYGLVGRTLRAYWKALKKRNRLALEQLYAPNARIGFYNYKGNQIIVFETSSTRRTFLTKLLFRFGRSWSFAKPYLRLSEEYATERFGNGHYTYKVRGMNVGSMLVFTECGKIYGEFVVANVPGLTFS
eukprot:TRINITY_DN64798_c0_g1_i1.p1 TRINITY_DN64798_c0_g1~~TRINITY_DN64798_c0_g1_i1.p1  ORF type:complete len:387 (+),score=19.30 TRINITY_DN64798_c0_g1_i1:152-1312(+)